MRLPTVIGCGNLTRSDDGVGCHVVRQLRDQAADRDGRARLLDAGTAGIAVLYAARGSGALIVVDACRGLGPAGAIFEVPGDVIDHPPVDGLNPHALRWDHAVHAGRRIFGDDFAADMTVYLVEATDLSPGLELSPPVASAAATLVRRISAQLEQS